MTRETIKFLWDIIHDGSLQDVELSLINNLLKRERPSDIDPKNIFTVTEGSLVPEPDYKVFLDYRIKRMSLDGFRTFPHREGKPYGINFCNAEGDVNSLLLIGSNGTGKSSVFSALEMAYTGFTSQAEERQVEQEIYNSYGLKKKSNAELNQSVQVSLVSEQGLNDYSNLATSASFCSSYDILQIEQCGEDMTDYILRQLGYGEILEIEELFARAKSLLVLERDSLNTRVEEDNVPSDIYMEVINEFLEIAYNDKSINVEGEETYKVVENIRNLVENSNQDTFNNLLFSKYWKSLYGQYTKLQESMQASAGIPVITANQTLQKEIDKQEYILSSLFSLFFSAYNSYKKSKDAKDVLTDLYKRYYDKKKIEESAIMTIGAAEELRAENERRDKAITTIQSLIITKKEAIVNDFSVYARSFIEKILANFAEPDEVFKVKSKNGLKVNIHVSQIGNTSFIAKPNQYLNSFRFVLFCVTLKVALSLWQMKNKNIVTPMVIDDVFDASDFENSLKLEEFFYWLLCSYKETALANKIKTPMQLILLTHDELMKTSFERAINKVRSVEALAENKKQRITTKIIYGRLVNYKYSEQIDSKKMNNGVLSNQTDILNLYYVL